MFQGGKAGKPVKKSDLDKSVTILTAGCRFTGKLFCSGSTRVGGIIEGEIVSEGILIIEEQAQIRANIKAHEVIVQGQVEGKLEVQSRLELAPTAIFRGDLVTPQLVVREGAQFNGRSVMNATAELGFDEEVEEPLGTPLVTTDLKAVPPERQPDVSVL